MAKHLLPALALAALVACTGGQQATVPDGPPSIRGTVTALDQQGERIGVLRIEEVPADSSGSDKASVRVGGRTRIYRREGEVLRRIEFRQLRVGQRAEAWFTGPVMESYPVQATAEVIVVRE